MNSILQFRLLKIPLELENHCLEEMNSYNLRQLKNMSIILFLISLVYIFQSEFAPRQGMSFEINHWYIIVFSILILLSILFLSLFKSILRKGSEETKKTLITLFVGSVSILLMILNFLDLHFGNEFSAYIVVLMYLSAVLWLSPKSYIMLSGFSFFLLNISFLIINDTMTIEPYQVLQGVIYFILFLFLFASINFVRTENFLNRVTLEEQYKMLETENTTDPLTGLYNRRSLKDELHKELSRSERSGSTFCAVMIDVDHFKKINDSYGHGTGDDVLRELAIVLRNSVRLSDKVFRYGGEEFVLILPETKGEDALILAERIREKVSTFSFSVIRNKISISLGISQSHEGISEEVLLQRADKRLYVAKQSGRNMVVWKKKQKEY